jgi:CO/xanthine dehydrogenase FAD-binding subunit
METALAAGELITAVRIPLDTPQSSSEQQELRGAPERLQEASATSAHHAYLKVTSRSADDWPSLGVAVSLRVMQGKIERAYIVIGAAVDRPTHLQSAESVLRGAAVSEQVIARAAESAAAEAKPIADQHGSAAYKKQLVRVYTARALRQALDLPRYGSPT